MDDFEHPKTRRRPVVEPGAPFEDYRDIEEREHRAVRQGAAPSQGPEAFGYPPGWPMCAAGCGTPALDGHRTCGRVECDERGRR